MQCEVVFLFLADVGQSIDLARAETLVKGTRAPCMVRMRKTPAYLSVPNPLVIDEKPRPLHDHPYCDHLALRVKLYEDGVVSVRVRVHARDVHLADLHEIERAPLTLDDHDALPPRELARLRFHEVVDRVASTITRGMYNLSPEEEFYTAYCIPDPAVDAGHLLQAHRPVVAALISGETPDVELHASQVDAILRTPLAFTRDDLALFNWDKCLLVDPTGDFDEVLLVVELANLQLLELRTLDAILERRLADADQFTRALLHGNPRKSRGRGLKRKINALFRLHIDALYVFEHQQNVTKIIGDYYFSQMFTHLGTLFHVDQWRQSIRSRLTLLENLYQMTRTDLSDRLLLWLEVFLTIVIFLEFLGFLFGVM